MSEMFKPVEVIKSFLGIKKGTVLKFDEHSSRYISRSGEEEIGENEYYYSGTAVELDPFIIENNMDKYFRLYELPEAKKKVAMPLAKELVPVVEEPKPEPELVKEESKAEPDSPEPKPFDLVFECGLCHFINTLAPVRTGIFLPAGEGVLLNMKCNNCGTTTKLYYTKVEDETTEESKSV